MTGLTLDIVEKPFMSYIMFIVERFAQDGDDEMRLVASGRNVGMAIDLALVVQDRFDGIAHIKGFDIRSRFYKNHEGARMRQSVVDISLVKGRRKD